MHSNLGGFCLIRVAWLAIKFEDIRSLLLINQLVCLSRALELWFEIY